MGVAVAVAEEVWAMAGREAAEELGGWEGGQCGSARMTESEMEAARALADLAEVEEGRSGSSLNEPRRGSLETEDEHGRQHVHESECAPPDAVQGCLLEYQERHKKVCKFLAIKAAKAPEGWELLHSRFKCSTNQGTSLRTKSMQSLCEADKEAKRMRRILANRESARQTIRRRQALCEELTKKVADLISDNERMKREKELVMREYKLLKDRNKHLRSLMATAMGKRNETPQEAVSILAEKSTSPSSSAQFQSFADNNSKSTFPLLFWPHMCPHAHRLSQVPSESNNSVCASSFIEPHKGLDLWREPVRGPMMPFCLIPCPWFYPISEDGSQSHPLRGHSDDAEAARPLEKEAKAQLSDLCQVIPEGSSSGTHNSAEPWNMRQGAYGGPLTHTPWRPMSTQRPIKFSSVNADPKDIQEPVSTAHIACPCKRFVDGVMAAEARKRRKEITNLKHLYVRDNGLPSCGTCSKTVL